MLIRENNINEGTNISKEISEQSEVIKILGEIADKLESIDYNTGCIIKLLERQ